VPRERDPFANFERMRRQMDELFGGALDRRAQGRRMGSGFVPSVDVYYCGDPPRVVVRAELAGVKPDEVGLEIAGRELTIAGYRRHATEEGRVYQQLEIAHGPFRRVVPLGADVEADAATAVYEAGVLSVELPLIERKGASRSVPIQVPGKN
jgi:HSP20 family protein